MQRYKLQKSQLRFFVGCFSIFFLILILLLIYHYSKGFPVINEIIVLCTLSIFIGFIIYALYTYEIVINDTGILEIGTFKSKFLKWEEIDDLICLESITVIRSSNKGCEIRIYHPLFPFALSLEGHFLLREQLIDTLANSLERKWTNKSPLNSIHSAQPLSITTHIIFLSLVVLIIWLLIQRDFFPFRPLLLLILLWFCYLYGKALFNSKRSFLVSEEGLVIYQPFKKTAIKWEELGEVLSPKKQTVGLGRIEIKTRDGKKIYIPRNIDRFSEFIYHIKTKAKNAIININPTDNTTTESQ